MICKSVSHYCVLEKLDGGMGTVYRAKDTQPGRFIALESLVEERFALPRGYEC
jgi:hypothetical protein